MTDSSGTNSTASQTFTLIALTARGYKQNGLERVDLSWNNSSRASFDVYRNGAVIATVQATAYTTTSTGKGLGRIATRSARQPGRPAQTRSL